MPSYNFTEAAENDLNGILDYTLQKWGVNQASIYLDGLERYTQLLADTPTLAKSVDQFAKELRAFPYKSHLIYFLEVDGGIIIARILHKSMSPSIHLDK